MEPTPTAIRLVDPGERLELKLGSSRLYYRRLSLGALASLERALAVWRADARGVSRPVVPPQALEDAICAHVLLGWLGVTDTQGRPVEYSPQAARRLPAAARRLLVQRARRLNP